MTAPAVVMRPRVLIVEDDRDTAQAYVRIFGVWGWEPAVASTYAAADAALCGPFDLVILDLMLPGGDGIDLLRRVRDEKIPIRVVVWTAKDAAAVTDVVALGPDLLLHKPYVFEVLQRFAHRCAAEVFDRRTH